MAHAHGLLEVLFEVGEGHGIYVSKRRMNVKRQVIFNCRLYFSNSLLAGMDFFQKY
jgi:hypothetical protein